ncbi:MAG: O-antigen ligase family protein [Opitutales bacterium]
MQSAKSTYTSSFPGSSGSRRRKHRTPIPQREKILLLLLSILLVFMPWALGSMHVWSQVTALAMAVGIFVYSLLPPPPSFSQNHEEEKAAAPWKQLLRFPIFWIGLLLLAYVAIQGFNPSWVYVEFGGEFWMVPIDYVYWLPSGMDTPFHDMDAFRYLIILSIPWLIVCGAWVGLSRKRSIRFLFWVLAINSLVLALVGFSQALLESEKILNLYETNARFLSTFIYRNHAAAYFNLMLGIAAGMGFYHFLKGKDEGKESTPAPLFAFFGILFALIVAISASRMGILITGALLSLIFLGGIFIFILKRNFNLPSLIAGAVLCLLMGGFTFFAIRSIDLEDVTQRLEYLWAGEFNVSQEARYHANQATLDMLEDNWIYGWGAGSFRFYFPVYQQEYPEIFTRRGQFLLWEYAHNDLLQLPVEFGAVGSAFFALGLAYWLWLILVKRGFKDMIILWALIALVATVVHSGADFIFHNPAILTTWAFVLALIGKLSVLQRREDEPR